MAVKPMGEMVFIQIGFGGEMLDHCDLCIRGWSYFFCKSGDSDNVVKAEGGEKNKYGFRVVAIWKNLAKVGE